VAGVVIQVFEDQGALDGQARAVFASLHQDRGVTAQCSCNSLQIV
jgi:hypothetical protein